jgi:hypothetical protein
MIAKHTKALLAAALGAIERHAVDVGVLECGWDLLEVIGVPKAQLPNSPEDVILALRIRGSKALISGVADSEWRALVGAVRESGGPEVLRILEDELALYGYPKEVR